MIADASSGGSAGEQPTVKLALQELRVGKAHLVAEWCKNCADVKKGLTSELQVAEARMKAGAYQEHGLPRNVAELVSARFHPTGLAARVQHFMTQAVTDLRDDSALTWSSDVFSEKKCKETESWLQTVGQELEAQGCPSLELFFRCAVVKCQAPGQKRASYRLSCQKLAWRNGAAAAADAAWAAQLRVVLQAAEEAAGELAGAAAAAAAPLQGAPAAASTPAALRPLRPLRQLLPAAASHEEQPLRSKGKRPLLTPGVGKENVPPAGADATGKRPHLQQTRAVGVPTPAPGAHQGRSISSVR